MTEDDDTTEWHERNPLFDPEAAEKHASGVYTSDGEPRDRGIFTHADREYIIDEREYNSRQQRSNVHRRQVRRVRDSLQDAQLLLWMDDRTKERIFENASPAFVHQTLRDIVRFFYEGMDRDPEMVEHAITSAIWEAESAAGEEIKDISTTIDIDKAPDVDVALQILEQGEYYRLTPEQIGVLAREGLLDEEDYEQLSRPGFGRDAGPFQEDGPPTPRDLTDDEH